MLRCALAAIDNVGAVTVVPAQQPTMPTEHFAGAVTGLGTTEVERRMVSNVQVRALLQTRSTSC
ncbi:MAG: hypothetical protein ACRDRS_08880 [Pseudonocardiaceae bacterium]